MDAISISTERQAVKGMTNMNNFYEKILYPFVENLIRENANNRPCGYSLNADDLSEEDQHQFATYLIQYEGQSLECIYENNSHDDIVSSLFTMLKENDVDHKLDFADLIRDKVISYYKKSMQQMIDDILPWVEQEDYSDRGYVRAQHSDNGEMFWVHR